MEIGLELIAFVVVLIGASILSRRIGVAAPLILVLLGIGIGFLPFMPLVEVPPEVILVFVLPPLLYASAVNVPLVDFRRNLRPVVGLSVFLVIISALVIGVLVHLMIPAIPLAVAIALGAIVSPTDAVAATSIGKRLGMPERDVVILEGESLVNDASSLVILKTAVAAIAGSFSLWSSVGTFFYAVCAAIAIGLLIGFITVWVRSKLENPVYDTVISFTVPYLAFFPAEEIGASGVLAVVVTGIYTGSRAYRRFSASARTHERLNWRTVRFALENGVFLLMGLQLHALAASMDERRLGIENVLLIAVLLVAVLIVCRIAFLVPLIWWRNRTRRYEDRAQRAKQLADKTRSSDDVSTRQIRRAEVMEQMTRADLEHEQEQPLGWRDGLVLSWSGMRGVVTLAASQTLPVDTPFRSQIIFVAFCVAVITLLLHGLSLPAMIKKLWPGGPNHSDASVELKALENDLVEAANAAIDDALADDPPDAPTPRAAVEMARNSASRALMPARISARRSSRQRDSTSSEDLKESVPHAHMRLARVVLEAQRSALSEERAIGRYRSATLSAAEHALDSYENRLRPPGQLE